MRVMTWHHYPSFPTNVVVHNSVRGVKCGDEKCVDRIHVGECGVDAYEAPPPPGTRVLHTFPFQLNSSST